MSNFYNDFRRFISNPWVVAVVLLVAFWAFLRKYRERMLAKVSSEVLNSVSSDFNSGTLTLRGAGVSFLVDGLSGLSDYLFGAGDRLRNYLNDYGKR